MINSSSRVPLYTEVYAKLRERILAGDYKVGDALPSEPRLREEFDVSTITVRRAIHELSLDGLIEPRQGIGNMVRDASARSVTVGLSSFTSDVVQGRLRLVRTLLADEVVSSSTEVAEKLHVQRGSLVRRLVRLDCEGNSPLEVDEVFVPMALAYTITTGIAGSPAFMELWRQAAGPDTARTEFEIWIDKATESDQGLLKIGSDCPVLVVAEQVFDSSDRPCAWIISRYRGDRGRMCGTLMVIDN